MSRQTYLDLAARSMAMPIGAELVLKEHPRHAEALTHGELLGPVLEAAARRFRTPLAFPVMDLQLEKAILLETLGIPAADVAAFHFNECPAADRVEYVRGRLRDGPLTARMVANNTAIAYIASRTELIPVGMCIGPFSLMTKLLADPITPVYLAGSGETAGESPEVALVERCLELGVTVILESLRHQIAAGARAIFIAEPAANKVYLSPNQLEAGSDIFERYVMAYNRRITALLEVHGVDLFFHCCGELTDQMVAQFAELRPVLLSLGSSRNLAEDARLVAKDIVLYGNLPSKQFYSDKVILPETVEKNGRELVAAMKAVGHPFILGTECDTLTVPGCEKQIWSKVDALMRCSCAHPLGALLSGENL